MDFIPAEQRQHSLQVEISMMTDLECASPLLHLLDLLLGLFELPRELGGLFFLLFPVLESVEVLQTLALLILLDNQALCGFLAGRAVSATFRHGDETVLIRNLPLSSLKASLSGFSCGIFRHVCIYRIEKFIAGWILKPMVIDVS